MFALTPRNCRSEQRLLRSSPVGHTLRLVTSDQINESQAPFQVQHLRFRHWLFELMTAIGITVGLALLWLCENLRNQYFHLLDRVNFKARARRASAFPPGSPRKLKP